MKQWTPYGVPTREQRVEFEARRPAGGPTAEWWEAHEIATYWEHERLKKERRERRAAAAGVLLESEAVA